MVNWVKLASVFCITTLVFLIGFLVGDYASTFQEDVLSDMRDNIYAEVASSEALYSFMADQPCNVQLEDFSAHLDKMNERLRAAEEKVGWRELSSIKAYYFATEIKHYLLINAINEKCSGKYIPVFYFYSNENCKYCLEQGLELDTLKKENPLIMIYAFDADNLSPLVTSLVAEYKISELPAIVINGITYGGFQSKDDLNKVLYLHADQPKN